jgi:aminoglycoside phosphotransferase family enzyme/predicted kinase
VAGTGEADFDLFAAFLADPATHGGARPKQIETHTAAVFLAGDRAYKLRRPVNYGWLDYGDRAKRRAAALREMAGNARTAPGLHIGLAGLALDGGRMHLTQPGDLPEDAEPVAVMHRFPEGALFDRMASDGRLTSELMHRTGIAIARMHRGAVLRPGTGDLPGMAYGRDTQLAGLAASIGPEVEQLLRAMGEAHRRLRPLIEHRRARRCHGDLHLGNIVLWQNDPAPFDAIDFNDAFTDIDPLFDLAFLLMDLEHRGHAELCPPLLNAWAEALSAAPGADVGTAYGGLALLPLYKAVRATIRAKVGALAVEAGAGEADRRRTEARAYLSAAMGYLSEPETPRLVAIGGFSGTGKSTVARALAARTGAVVLRSDGIRKGLHGVSETERLPGESYTPAASDRVYGELLFRAALALGGGHLVIVDAAHLRAREREAIGMLARRLACRFDGLWLEAPDALLRARLAERTSDASDADATVLSLQLGRDPGPVAWARIDAGGAAESTAALAMRALRL